MAKEKKFYGVTLYRCIELKGGKQDLRKELNKVYAEKMSEKSIDKNRYYQEYPQFKGLPDYKRKPTFNEWIRSPEKYAAKVDAVIFKRQPVQCRRTLIETGRVNRETGENARKAQIEYAHMGAWHILSKATFNPNKVDVEIIVSNFGTHLIIGRKHPSEFTRGRFKFEMVANKKCVSSENITEADENIIRGVQSWFQEPKQLIQKDRCIGIDVGFVNLTTSVVVDFAQKQEGRTPELIAADELAQSMIAIGEAWSKPNDETIREYILNEIQFHDYQLPNTESVSGKFRDGCWYSLYGELKAKHGLKPFSASPWKPMVIQNKLRQMVTNWANMIASYAQSIDASVSIGNTSGLHRTWDKENNPDLPQWVRNRSAKVPTSELSKALERACYKKGVLCSVVNEYETSKRCHACGDYIRVNKDRSCVCGNSKCRLHGVKQDRDENAAYNMARLG